MGRCALIFLCMLTLDSAWARRDDGFRPWRSMQNIGSLARWEGMLMTMVIMDRAAVFVIHVCQWTL